MTELATPPRGLAELPRETLLRQAEDEGGRVHVALEQLDQAGADASLPEVASLLADAVAGELRSLRYTLMAAIAAEPAVAAEASATWARIDLFGHRHLVGHVRETTVAGRRFLEVTVPSTTHERREQEPLVYPEETTLYSPGAVYSMEPCSKAEVLADLQECREIPF